MLNSSVNRVAPWHSRDFEAQVLVDLLRLSRVTLMYGAEGAGKTTLLKTGIVPRLRSRVDEPLIRDDNLTTAPLSVPHACDETEGNSADIVIIFDQWDDAPLATLRSQILDTLGIETAPMAGPHPDLAASLAAWNKAFGVRFFIILDGFERYLRAPVDRAGIVEFEDEFVRSINAPRLATHFLLSIRDDAEGLLDRFRERISGFGDAFIRLPKVHAVSEAPRLPERTPAGLDDSGVPLPSLPSENEAVDDMKAKRVLRGITGVEPTIRERLQLYRNSGRAQFIGVPKPRGAATAATAPRRRKPLRRSVRKLARVYLGPIICGLVIGAGASYLAVSQGTPPWHTALTPESAVPMPGQAETPPQLPVTPATRADPPPRALDSLPVPVIPAARADPAAQLPPSERASTVDRPVSPPASPASIKNPRHAASTREFSARIDPPSVAAIAPAAVGDWQSEMHKELDACRQERFFSRVVCMENVRWKRCAPDRWNTAPECGVGGIQTTAAN